ncbi:MAG TPA: hypothetical protein VK669_12265 [Candidatus Limnocylindrales bacterium]|nr:hypothetical protein [Candidatus Limnocylindrales bacterium]
MLTAAVLALTAAAHRPPQDPQCPQDRKPPKVVRAAIASGDHQVARSYAALGATSYIATFDKPLLVRVGGPGTRKGHPRHVVFTCEGCIFAPMEQHGFDDFTDRAKDENSGKDLPAAYDTKPARGIFGVHVALQVPVVAGTYRVRAEPVPNCGEKAVATWFTLTTR